MKISTKSVLSVAPRKPLAACCALLFALATPEAMAIPPTGNTWVVNSCSDANSGTGSTGTLRYAAAHAVSNDVIDMTGLTCSKISLQTGTIGLTQSNIRLKGPGMHKLTISGKYNGTTEPYRIFTHTGSGGTAHFYDMTISDGYAKGSSGLVQGGCIYSAGAVYLTRVYVADCTAAGSGGAITAEGGAIFARTGATLFLSSVSNNVAGGAAGGGAAFGGGIYSGANLEIRYSTVSGNTAGSIATSSGIGGGAFFKGARAVVFAATVSGNTAGVNDGGLALYGTSATSYSYILNSTVSGNNAGHLVGGVYANTPKVGIGDSTIAFNTAGIGRTGTASPYTYYAPGVTLRANSVSGNMTVTLQSSLIANNTYGSTETDLSGAITSPYSITFGGNNNLVRAPASLAKVPPDTITISCPLLGPLRNNGGPTLTHALLSHSPGIDQGNNVLPYQYDQRGGQPSIGPLTYPRVSPTGGVTDIGAYEVQQADIIFNSGFEGCPVLF